MPPTTAPTQLRSRRRTARLSVAATAICLLLSSCLGRSDSLSPVIAITDPRSGATRSTEDLRISGYAMDDEGVASIRVDGLDLLANDLYASERGKGLVNFAFTKPNVVDGELTMVLEVTDVSGRTTTETYTLILDATPPTVELTTVEAAAGNRLRVEGVARDNIGVSSVRIGGVPLAFTPGPEFSFSVLVQNTEGAQVVVEDGAGNSASAPLQ
ncbi:MAG TPA: hypothetical protein VFF10_03975 [Trueperaceae bacterium]|nr:hypothetical protein [Trueperaceae bacterium]